MRIVALVGSYRKNGNTDQIVHLISEQLRLVAAGQQESLEVETIYLGRQQILPCRGCRVCFDRGEEKCPCRDDMPSIKAKMKDADGVLVASPVYVDDVNGITKNWIDRLAHVCHRPEFAGKCAYLVTTVAASPTRHSLRTLTMALRTWGFDVVGQAGFKMGARMEPETTAARFQKQAEKIASEMYQAIRQRKATRPSFYSLMVFKIQQRSWQRFAQTDTLDYQYWARQGWFDPKRTFYIAHASNPAKVALARFVGRIIAPFVA